MTSCGRLSFDRGAPNDANGTSDAPPLPTAICNLDRIPLTTVPRVADLTIAPISEGYAAIWVDAAAAGAAHGALLGPNRQLLSSLAMPDITDTQLGGIADAGQKLVLSSATGMVEKPWILGRDLTTATQQGTLANHVMGRDPYPSDAAQSPRAFLTASADTLMMAYVASDGLINPQSSVFIAGGPITALACNDGPNHAHCVWTEKLTTGGSQCTATDISFGIPTMPQIGSREVLSSDCYDIRNASGPDPADSMIIVWTTGTGGIEARYIASTGNVSQTITTTGSAPKVRFDGTRFWIAWLDDKSVLQLSSFDLNGTIVHYPLPGWTPAGPEAFELVRRGNTVGLVLLSPSELDFLTICN